jgi:hypothetical protein
MVATLDIVHLAAKFLSSFIPRNPENKIPK